MSALMEANELALREAALASRTETEACACDQDDSLLVEARQKTAFVVFYHRFPSRNPRRK